MDDVRENLGRIERRSSEFYSYLKTSSAKLAVKGRCVTMRKNIEVTKEPTSEQIAMLQRVAALPISADNECPEFSKAELTEFRRIQVKEG